MPKPTKTRRFVSHAARKRCLDFHLELHNNDSTTISAQKHIVWFPRAGSIYIYTACCLYIHIQLVILSYQLLSEVLRLRPGSGLSLHNVRLCKSQLLSKSLVRLCKARRLCSGTSLRLNAL